MKRYTIKLKKKIKSKILNSDPKIKVYKNFMSSRECAAIIQISKDKLCPAKVTSNEIEVLSYERTGTNCFIPHIFNETTLNIAKRISKIVGLPIENAEDLQIIHYDKDQEYMSHYDGWINDKSVETLHNFKRGGQRITTAICYLNTPTEGGSTYFPNLDIDIPAEKGKLLIFSNVYEGSNIRHPMSLHSGTPIIKGEKYGLTIFFREKQHCDKLYKTEKQINKKTRKKTRN